MMLGWFIAGILGALLLTLGMTRAPVRRAHDVGFVVLAWLTIALMAVRRIWHPHVWPFRWMTDGWTALCLALICIAGILYVISRYHGPRVVMRLVAIGTFITALLVPATGAMAAPSAKPTVPPSTSTATTEPKNTNKVPQIPGWALHYYQFDPGVPTNYFGPACVPNGDANKCKSDLETRMKHDPVLLSAIMLRLHLLPSYFLEEHQNNISSLTDPNQLELYRHQAARELVNVKLRMKWQPRVAAVLDSIPDFHIEALSGSFYTEYVTSSGQVVQTTKQMNPQINFAITGTMPSGEKLMIKIDCGHQPVSPRPLPGVPMIPSKTPPLVTPPTTTPPTTPPTTSKCANQHHFFNGHDYCGTPTSGPEQQPVQSNPCCNTTHTTGYVPGSAEQHTGPINQPPPPTNGQGQPTYVPNPNGYNNGGVTTPGASTNPDGSTTQGGTSGVSNPDPNANPDPGTPIGICGTCNGF